MLQKAGEFLGSYRIFHGIFPRKGNPVLTNGETNYLGDKSIEKEVKFKNRSYKKWKEKQEMEGAGSGSRK